MFKVKNVSKGYIIIKSWPQDTSIISVIKDQMYPSNGLFAPSLINVQ